MSDRRPSKTFLLGYADAWAGRDPKNKIPAYLRGYEEGVEDAERAYLREHGQKKQLTGWESPR